MMGKERTSIPSLALMHSVLGIEMRRTLRAHAGSFTHRLHDRSEENPQRSALVFTRSFFGGEAFASRSILFMTSIQTIQAFNGCQDSFFG
jgi:hypothetical protein